MQNSWSSLSTSLVPYARKGHFSIFLGTLINPQKREDVSVTGLNIKFSCRQRRKQCHWADTYKLRHHLSFKPTMARVPFTRVPIEKFNFRVPSIQHFFHLVAYVTWVAAVIYQGITSRSLTPQEDPLKKYGAFITYFSICVRLLAMLIIPQMAAMTLGLILYDIRWLPTKLN